MGTSLGGTKTSIRRLGKVLHLSKSGRLILRSQTKVKLGSVAVNEDLKNIGTIFDVFGPAENPYVSIKPSVRDPSQYVGQLLFVEESIERRR